MKGSLGVSAWPLATTVFGFGGQAQAIYNMGAFWRGSSVGATAAGASLRLRSSGPTYLSRTFSAPTNNKIMTLSVWVKKTGILSTLFDMSLLSVGDAGSVGISGAGAFGATYDNRMFVRNGTTNKDYWFIQFRDPSAWFHVVVTIDTTQATQSDRARMYVNGVEQAKGASSLGLNEAIGVNTATTHYIGGYAAGYYANGYISDYCFVDGQALSPTVFGKIDTVTGAWVPQTATQIRSNVIAAGGWGANGFYLPFANNTSQATLGYDYQTSSRSGTKNDWTLSWNPLIAGLSYDAMIDSPAKNFACLSQLTGLGTSYLSLNSGNLQGVGLSGNYSHACATQGMTTGKWYCEVPIVSSDQGAGLTDGRQLPYDYLGGTAKSYGYHPPGYVMNNAASYLTGLASFTVGDVVQMAYDADTRKFWFGKNGAWHNSGNPALGTNPTFTAAASDIYFFAVGDMQGLGEIPFAISFGQAPLIASSNYDSSFGGYARYPVPSGFKALCAANLPDPVIKKPSQHFDVLAYTGNGQIKAVRQMGATSSVGIPAASFPYAINNSLRFRASASPYLSRTFGAGGNTRKMTFSYWFKRGSVTNVEGHFTVGTNGQNYFTIGFGFALNNPTRFEVAIATGNVMQAQRLTVREYRDPSRWYHAVVAFDTDNATAANRIKIWIDGVQETDFSNSVDPALNWNIYGWNASGTTHYISSGLPGYASLYMDTYLAEVHFIDGQALTASSFGQTEATTGTWIPKQYTGTYGTTGFYLPFSDTSGLTSGSNAGIGKDFSGNSNYWNTNNISLTAGVTYDAMIDSPTNGAGGTRPVGTYPILNPLTPAVAGLSGGGLTSTSSACHNYSTIQLPTTGKWYFEGTATSYWYTGAYYVWGAVAVANATGTYSGILATSNGTNGGVWQNGVFNQAFTSWANDDAIGIAVDMDAGTVQGYRNGVAVGTPVGLPSGDLYFYVSSYAGGNVIHANFGQRPFSYAPPSGFKALCAANFPAASADYWTPDLLWVKDRKTANNHVIADSARGIFRPLTSNTTAVEVPQNQAIQRVYPGGFIVGNDTTVGTLNDTYVAWMWKAGGYTGSINSVGSISSTASINATAGISLIKYVGTGAAATVGHGLGVTPSFILIRNLSSSTPGFCVWHGSFSSANNYLQLWTTNAAGSAAIVWNGTAPSSTVISLGTDLGTNNSTHRYIGYCFAEVQGFSKMGSYTGNGNADGPLVWCGFRPKWILIKSSSYAGSNWIIYDAVRNAYNLIDASLYANGNSEEQISSTVGIDILAGGFKIRTTDVSRNNNNDTYLFVAFADFPFKYATAR